MLTIGSLFSGIGGLELGLEWSGLGRALWQVERDPFCRSVLARHWPDAERFDDVCTVGSHCLRSVDVICGGFPCQDLSFAGKGRGLAGERSGLWFEYLRIVRELRPRVVIVENVAALVTRGLDVVLGGLAEAGYDAEWLCLRASDVGAPHRRERLFVMAYRIGDGWPIGSGARCVGPGRNELADGGTVANAYGERQLQRKGRVADVWRRIGDGCEELGNASRIDGGRERRIISKTREARGAGSRGRNVANADVTGLQGRFGPERIGADERTSREGRTEGQVDGGGSAEPGMGRVFDGLPARVDRWPSRPGEAQHDWEAPRVAQSIPQRAARLKALGNAVVPQVAEVVGRIVRSTLAPYGTHH